VHVVASCRVRSERREVSRQLVKSFGSPAVVSSRGSPGKALLSSLLTGVLVGWLVVF